VIERYLAALAPAFALLLASRRIAKRREATLSAAERAALQEIRRCGLGLAWDVRTTSAAMMKVRKLSPRDATARARLGVAMGLADGSLPLAPSLEQLAAAAHRGDRSARARLGT
jgi:hypothetical protein